MCPGLRTVCRRPWPIPGAIGASIVDYTTGLSRVRDDRGRTQRRTNEAAAAGTGRRRAGGPEQARCSSRRCPHDLLEDLIITTAGATTLLRLVQTDFDSRLVLYVWLDRIRGNLAVARRRMQTLADELVAT
jgi:hypothetical protein